jgi:hypothetical protein
MSLKDFFHHIGDFFARIPHEVREAVSNSLAVTTAIKKFMDGPVPDILTAIIPGDWDDELKKLIREKLSQVMPYLIIVDNCKQYEDLEALMLCWIDQVKKQPKEVQDALMHKLAALLTAYQHGKAEKQSFYDFAVQLQYTHNRNGV